MMLPGLSHMALGRPRRAAPPTFAAGNVSYNSVAELGRAMSQATGLAGNATAGGTLSIDGKSLGSYDYAIKNGNQSVSSGFTLSNWFTTTQDSRSAWVAINGNLTINSGAVFTPSVRKLFTVIYVTGDLIVNGSIAMTARGANHSASGSNITAQDIRVDYAAYTGVTNPIIPAAGAAGGAQTAQAGGGQSDLSTPNPGSAGANGQSGGGGSGQGNERGRGGAGAAGTSFGGGPAGGGGRVADGGAGTANGGQGGNGVIGNGAGNRAASGGAGNPGGSNHLGSSGGSYYVADSGTGGTLLIIVEGTISGSGTIESQGSRGGSVNYGAGGGGSGGGAVTVLCLSLSGVTLNTTGGRKGYGGNDTDSTSAGANGGNGHGRVLPGYYW